MEIWLLWLVWVSCEWQDVFYTENSISILVFTHHKSLILYFHIFTIFIYFTIETQVMKSSLTAKTRVPCTVDVWITSELTVNASRILFSPAQPSWIDQGAFMRSRGLSRFVTLIFLNPPPSLSTPTFFLTLYRPTFVRFTFISPPDPMVLMNEPGPVLTWSMNEKMPITVHQKNDLKSCGLSQVPCRLVDDLLFV